MQRSLRRIAFASLTTALALGLLEGCLAVVHRLLEARARAGVEVPVGAALTLVCAGDSVTAGFPGDPDDAWPALLAGLPAAEERGVAVVNLARPGSSGVQVAARIAEGLARVPGPAVVLSLAGFNDCVRLRAGVDVAERGFAVERASQLLWGSRSYRLLVQAVRRIARAGPVRVARPPDTDPRVSRCVDAVRAGVRAGAEAAKGRDATYVALAYPVPARPDPGKPEGSWLTALVDDAVASGARAAGVPFLDPRACVAAAEQGFNEPFYVRDDLHLTRAGAGALARCVAGDLGGVLGAR
ncbi:MAG: SGNH/GDSL hydrolase family protein [Myxococcota bacterium]